MKKIFILLISIASTLSTFSQDKKVGGITMPGKLMVDKQDLVLNGAGIREKYFVDMLVCGLYLKNKSKEELKIKVLLACLFLQNFNPYGS